jgi:hypothetical protein
VTVLIFDNTPLSHFARAGALPVLENITADFECIAPAEVIRELIRGVSVHPALATAISLPWINIVELTDVSEVVGLIVLWPLSGRVSRRYRPGRSAGRE